MSSDFANLSPDRVMDAIESLGYRCDARILELNSYENRVYQIGIEDAEPLIGKFYRPERWSDEQILEEHEYTLDLEQEDLSVVAPLVLDGKTLFQYEEFRFALYPRRGGRAPNIDNLDNLEILGRHIGKIHAEGQQRRFKYRPEISVETYGVFARKYLLENHFIPDELLPAYTTLSEQLLVTLEQRFDQAAAVEQIRLHGDCHMGNVLWRDDVPHFVDFDDARNGVPIQDLWMMLSGERDEQTMQLDAILEGYQMFTEFDRRQIQLIEPLRTLRIMYHGAWLAVRWEDPAFPRAFPFFNTLRYWSDHVLELREQAARLQEPAIELYQ
jgi:Ser/Thr protein kinase RdoA (MazF antagonist)